MAPNTFDDVNLSAVPWSQFIRFENMGDEDVDVAHDSAGTTIATLVPGQFRWFQIESVSGVRKQFHVRSVVGVSEPIDIEVTE